MIFLKIYQKVLSLSLIHISSNIEEIKSYFTDEQVIRSIASLTGMDFDTLGSGEYRLFL